MSKHAQGEQEQKGWGRQVNTGLQMKRAGEEMVAKALRARLDKVGEKEWLQECEDEWGWGRTQAYAHLNPELLAKARERVAEARSYSTNAAPRQVASGPINVRPLTPAERVKCEMPSAEHDVAVSVMHLNSVLEEGEFTVAALKEYVMGEGTWKIQEELRKLINTLTRLQKELDK